jgi:cyanobactin biosynthesis protein (PatB/AcyB/McaB family)
MDLPTQAKPVNRFEVVDPATTVDVIKGRSGDVFEVRWQLIHGYNFNDPSPFRGRGYEQKGSFRCRGR